MRLTRLALIFGSSLLMLAQDPIPTFRTETALVKVDLEPVAPGGQTIRGLEQNDFVVLDDDNPRKVVSFARQGEILRLVLLLDVSGSMRPQLKELAQTAKAALAQLHQGDEVALMLFSERTVLAEPFTTNLDRIPGRILDLIYKTSLGEDTLINESIADACSYLSKTPKEGRRALLMVTDNQSLRSALSDTETTRRLQDQSVVLNAIVVGGTGLPEGTRYGNPTSAPPDVRKYARQTGGEVVTKGKIGEVFGNLIQSIRTRYSLQYAMPAGEPGSFHRIRVELSPEAATRFPGTIIRARDGYYIPR